MTEPASGWPSRVAVVGAGTMGIGISHVFATSGIPTVLVDATAELSEAALTRSLELIRRAEEDGNVERDAAREAEDHLSAAVSVDDAVRGADLVVEAVVERTEVKVGVYAAIEAAASDEAVIATNTSSIPIAQLAAGLRRPERFLGVHWFVPPLLVPCVEVIRSAAAAHHVVEQVVEALTRLGKMPVVVGDGPGFVANRIQFAMFKEATRIVEEGARRAGAGGRGRAFLIRLPAALLRPVHDCGHGGPRCLRGHLRHPRGRPRRRLRRAPSPAREHVDRGEFGVKTGRGFLELSQAQAEELIDRRNRAYVALARLRQELEG